MVRGWLGVISEVLTIDVCFREGENCWWWELVLTGSNCRGGNGKH